MIKCVLFDFWGTLVDFGGEKSVERIRMERAQKFMDELRNYGYSFSYEKVWNTLELVRIKCTQIRDTTYKEISAREVTGMTLKELNVHSSKVYNKCAKIYSDVILSMELSLFEGAVEVLKWLKENRFKIGLLSNTEHGTVERSLLDRFGIRGYFDLIIFSCDVGVRKPSPEIFKYALNRLVVSPTESVYVGDWPEVDILGAKHAEMRTIYLKSGDEPYPEEVPLPDATIKRLTEIRKVLATKF